MYDIYKFGGKIIIYVRVLGYLIFILNELIIVFYILCNVDLVLFYRNLLERIILERIIL